MISDTAIVPWGVEALSKTFPAPVTGNTMLLEGSNGQAHAIAMEMVCSEISSGRPVHWIDGGMLLDPSKIIPILTRKSGSSNDLRLLQGCRAFTAHQMLDLVRRAQNDVNSMDNHRNIRLVIITELIRMFADTQVRRSEGQAMLGECLSLINALSRCKNILILMTMTSGGKSAIYGGLSNKMRKYADERVSVFSYNGTDVVATHHNLEISCSPIQNLQHCITLNDFHPVIHSSNLVCTRPPFDNKSSEIPNGDNMESVARRASAS